MKIKITPPLNFYAIVIVMFAGFSSFSQSDYYYCQGEKIFLTTNYQYVNIVTANAFIESSLSSSNLQSFSMRAESDMRNGEYKKIAKLEFTSIPINQSDYTQKIADIKNTTNVEGVYP